MKVSDESDEIFLDRSNFIVIISTKTVGIVEMLAERNRSRYCADVPEVRKEENEERQW